MKRLHVLKIEKLFHVIMRKFVQKRMSEQDVKAISGIIDFWFEPGWDRDSSPSEKYAKLWFGGGEALDREIKDRFADDHSRATTGEYNHWKEDSQGRIAYVLLLDQFSRNLYRKQAKAFEFDPEAQEVSKEVYSTDSLRNRYKAHELMFLYMPLMHAEDVSI